ncbi:hypothetical protein U6W85_12060 [Cutibacterium acnes]
MFLGGGRHGVVDDGADGGQPQPAAGLVDRGLRGLFGQALTPAKARGAAGAGGESRRGPGRDRVGVDAGVRRRR